MSARRPVLLRAPWRLCLALVLAVVAAACGGGGGVDTGGTGAAAMSFANGRISGFGSIIVNGVHYDDTNASIVDDEGQSHRPDDLQLGMTVQIEAGPITNDATGTATSVASRVAFGSDIRGAVESVDVATTTLRVLGQAVTVDVNTVIAGYTGLSAVRPGDVVQVYTFFDPSSGAYTATRLEHLGAQSVYKLRGPIAHLDTTAKTFTIGGAIVDYGSVAAADLPGLQEGATARVDLRTQTQSGRWVATRIVTGLPGIPADSTSEIEGYVTDFVDLGHFRVDGAIVDASGPGVVFGSGNASQLANGARIVVDGRMHDGVLEAERIEVRRKAPDNQTTPTPEPAQQFQVKGQIESVDTATKSFVVRGTPAFYDQGTEFDKGDASDLAVGRTVMVRGTLSSGERLHAEEIKFFK